MPKPSNKLDQMARDAADRINRQVAMGKQLDLIPDVAAPQAAERKVGRPKGSENKGTGQMRKWLAARGLKMPEDQLVEMAGMASGHDAFTLAMVRAEQLLAWAGDGAVNMIFVVGEGHKVLDGPWEPDAAAKIDAFKFFYGMALKANEAILPYSAPKATPDVNVQQSVFVNVPSAPSTAQPGDTARVISGRTSGRMVPADVAYKDQQKQDVTETDADSSDAESRTE